MNDKSFANGNAAASCNNGNSSCAPLTWRNGYQSEVRPVTHWDFTVLNGYA